ncbi:MAG TPA: hypothetical protein PLQ36_01955, partial [Candidatus Gracilibacteria bacterium]|nr:hypothetical protein [Candidatus Gracilibacteria bacterium]
IVDGGQIGYTQLVNEEESYYESERNYKRLVEVAYIMIDGAKKARGDITTLTLAKNQYAFAEEKSGRFFLIINGKMQASTGDQVLFLDPISTNVQEKNKNIEVNTVYYGLISKMGKNYYIRDKSGRKKLSVSDEKQITPFLKKKVYVNCNKQIDRSNPLKPFMKYQVLDISLQEFKKTSADPNAPKLMQGTLERIGSTFYLRGQNKRYNIRVMAPLNTGDLESFINNNVKLYLKKNGNYYEVKELPLP